MVGSASRDGIWPTAGFFDLPQRLFPALLEADAEFSGYEPHVRPGQPADQDVADLVVDRIWPVHPAFLDEHALEAYPGRDRRDLAGVVGLHAADRNQRVAAFGQGIGDQVLQLARLVTAVGDPRVTVLALGPDGRAAQMRGQPFQRVHRRWAEQQRVPLKRADRHRILPNAYRLPRFESAVNSGDSAA